MSTRAVAQEALRALAELERRRGELRAPPPPEACEWSTADEVARELELPREAVRVALERLTEDHCAEEHRDWRGCFRLTASGRDALSA